MSRTVKPRSYRSSHRARQAALTRETILAAARKRFASDGYAATTIEAIARDAEVASATIYAVFGSKRAIATALADRVRTDWEPQIESLFQKVAIPTDTASAKRQLRLQAHISVSISTLYDDIFVMLRSAAATDAEWARTWRTAERERLESQRPLVKAMADRGLFRAEIGEALALDILWSLTGPTAHKLFVGDRGWPAQEFEQWLGEALIRLLLRS